MGTLEISIGSQTALFPIDPIAIQLPSAFASIFWSLREFWAI
jgi:hypothetical protein